MFIAKNKENGQMVYIDEADYNAEYICPVCNSPVIIKHGSINVPHFAHKNKTLCDTFSQDMSEWHKWWQAQFPKKNREHVEELTLSVKEYYRASIKHQFYTSHTDDFCAQHGWDEQITIKHRADVRANGYVVEFQNSPISRTEFNERNWFYQAIGCKVIWVFNLIDEVDEERLKWYEETNNGAKWQWKNPRKTFMSVVPQRYKKTTQPSSGDAVILFVQIAEQTEEEDGIAYMERITWAKPHDYEESVSDYSRFITKYDICTALELKEAIINKAL